MLIRSTKTVIELYHLLIDIMDMDMDIWIWIWIWI